MPNNSFRWFLEWFNRKVYNISNIYIIISILVIYVVYTVLIALSSEIMRSDISEQYLIMDELAIATVYLVVGNIFLLNKIKLIIENINNIKGDKDKTDPMPLKRWYFIFIIFFLMIIFSRGVHDPFPYIEFGFAAFLFELYNLLIGIFIIVLLGGILGFIINIYQIIKSFEEINTKHIETLQPLLLINSNILSIKNSIIQSNIYYFIGVTLLILTYNNPISTGKYEILILSMLLITGLALFLSCLASMRRLKSCRMEYELGRINRSIQDKNIEVLTITEANDFAKSDKLIFCSKVLDILRKQRDDLINTDKEFYDLKTIGKMIGSAIFAVIGIASKPSFDILLKEINIAIGQIIETIKEILGEVTNYFIDISLNYIFNSSIISEFMR